MSLYVYPLHSLSHAPSQSLIRAARSPHLVDLMRFAAAGVDLNTPDPKQGLITALHEACRCACVRLRLDVCVCVVALEGGCVSGVEVRGDEPALMVWDSGSVRVLVC